MNGRDGAATGIVVGLEDSEPGRAAMAWAAHYAQTTGTTLHAVHVVDSSPVATTWTPGFPTMAYVQDTSARDESARAAIRKIFQSTTPAPEWTLEFVEGSAGDELVTESEQAQLLVIGTPAHRGLQRLVAGSVGHYCVNHARCPVVAVPATNLSAKFLSAKLQ